jgi:sulfate adenylyltransferase subunit 1 (EFTu-like GTPase family)
LEYLQTKWAAHLPYAAATALLKEILPLQDTISASGTRYRIRATGDEIDSRIEEETARLGLCGVAEQPRESAQVTLVSVDSVWLKCCAPARGYAQQVNIAAGRATLADGRTRLYAYVGKQVDSAAARRDHFLL